MHAPREHLHPPPSVPLTEAAQYVDGMEKIRVIRVMQKIPIEMQGIFGAIITDGRLTGIELLPNPATCVMNRLAEHVGLEAREQANHSPTQTQRWEGEAFDRLMKGTSHFNAAANTQKLIPYSRTKPEQAQEMAAAHGLTYQYSTTLSQLLSHSVLSRAEQHALERAAKTVPANLRGVFCCDVARDAEGKLAVSAMGIDPNQVTNRTALELMEPLLAPAASFMREDAQRAGIRPHNYAFMLPRDAYLTLADAPPETARARG